MNILITGGTGLLGSALLNLFPENFNIFLLTRTQPVINNFKTPNVKIVLADLNKTLDFSELPEQLDVIIHLAQSKLFREFPEKALDVFDVNIASTARLLDYAKRVGVKHFLYSSSGSVYEPYDMTMQEEQPIDPTSYYAISKFISEKIILSYSSYFSTCILRLFFLYGPGTSDMLIPRLIQKVKNNEPILLDGSEGLVFNPTHVHDVSKIILSLIKHEISGIYNIANPHAISLYEVGKEVAKLLGKEAIFLPSGKAISTQIVPVLDKMQQLPFNLNFMSFTDGLKSMI